MSYARWGWGDPPSSVYVFLAVSGHLECCGCHLVGEDGKWQYGSTDEMVAHLREHEKAGDAIPHDLITDLERDREENDAYITAGGHRD